LRSGWQWTLFPLALLAAGTAWTMHCGSVQSGARKLTDWAAVRDTKLKRTWESYRTPEERTALSDDTAQPVGQSGLAIRITMTEGQARAFRDGRKGTPRKKEEVSLAFGAGPSRSALITTHGWSTEDTERKSFAVRLFKRQSLTDDVEVRKFLLINMLYDKGSFCMETCYRWLGELDLFPCYHQYVNVFINGEPQGLYLLVERPEDAIRRSRPDVVSILRRRWMEVPELKFAGPQANPFAAYRRIVHIDPRLHGRALAGAYASDLDLDQYLRWLAFNSLVRNGDYLDEVFFYQEHDSLGRPEPLRLVAWDYDDVFHPPGHKRAFSDSLLYSCEADIDSRIQSDPVLRARYAASLRQLLTAQLTEEHLVATLADIRRTVNGFDTGESAAVQTANRDERDAAMAVFQRQLLERRRVLLRRLDEPMS
jgi:hypothetical protein